MTGKGRILLDNQGIYVIIASRNINEIRDFDCFGEHCNINQTLCVYGFAVSALCATDYVIITSRDFDKTAEMRFYICGLSRK